MLIVLGFFWNILMHQIMSYNKHQIIVLNNTDPGAGKPKKGKDWKDAEGKNTNQPTKQTKTDPNQANPVHLVVLNLFAGFSHDSNP